MMPSERSDVEVHVVVFDVSSAGDARFRRYHDDDGEGLWIKPELDGDGEFVLRFADLRAVAEAMNLNRADVWPEETR